MEKIPVRHIRTTATESHGIAPFNIRDISARIADKDLNEPLHRHDYFFFLVIITGTGAHTIDFITHQVKDCTVFLLRPGQVHQLQLAADTRAYLLQFNKEFYTEKANELNRAASQPCYYIAPDAFTEWQLTLQYMLLEFAAKGERYEDILRAQLQILLIRLIRLQNNRPGSQADHYIQDKLDRFLGLLEQEFTTHKQAADYAAIMNLSSYQLNTITRTSLGKTISELITDRILLEAKRLLLATSGQISKIAYQLGYEDVSYFIRFFKRHTGYSPESFRQNFS